MTLAILGVTGFTGRLVLAEARRGGSVRLVGRRQEALKELARRGRRRASRMPPSRRGPAACDGARRRVLCRPVPGVGLAPVRAAIAGAHYLDTSGERRAPGTCTTASRRPAGSRAGVRVPYVPGDLAASLAAEQVEGPLDEIVVAYSVKGVGTSRGTRRTIAACWARGRSPGRTAGSFRPGSARPPAACASRSASGRSSSGAGPSRSPRRATPTSETSARTCARRRRQGGKPRRAGGAS